MTTIYGSGRTLKRVLEGGKSGPTVRRELAASIPGIGPKQASLFLSSIGYADDVAVLDRHVLSYMEWVGLSDGPIAPPQTLRSYERLEARLRQHLTKYNAPLPACDLAIWVVVRVVKKEFCTWVS
jgi:N-glycosylase/DNA lyase